MLSNEPLYGDEMDLVLCFLELDYGYVKNQTSKKAAKNRKDKLFGNFFIHSKPPEKKKTNDYRIRNLLS